MIITIAGNLGSGKSTVCGILKDEYGFEIYSTGKIQREYAEKMGISTLEMNKLMNTDPKYDHIIDDEVVRISKEATSPMIFDSRMAWHFVEKSLKVFLIIDPQIAAERVFGTRDSLVETYASKEEAKNKLLERAQTENIRYKEIYHVDNLDYKNYDVIIDTSYIPPEKVASIIYDEYTNRVEGEETSVYISPRNVYPTLGHEEDVVEKIDTYRKNNGKETIRIVKHGHYHLAMEGNYSLLASLADKNDIVLARLYFGSESVEEKIDACCILDHKRFEEAIGFSYSNYPDYYKV